MAHLISAQTSPFLQTVGRDECIDILKGAGFEAVDYGISSYAVYAYAARHEGDSLFEKSDAEVLSYFHEETEAFRKSGLVIGQTHAPFPSNRLTDTGVEWGEHHQRLARLALQITADAGCPYMVLHPVFNNHIYYDGNAELAAYHWEQNLQFLRPLFPLLKDTGVKILLENMWGRVFQTVPIFPSVISHAPEFIEWIDRLNEEAGAELFGACLDTGHAILTGDDPAQMVTALGTRLKALHMHDVRPDHDMHTTMFEGDCDWAALADALAASPYTGTLNYETGGFPKSRPQELYRACAALMAEGARWFRARVDGE